MIRFAFFIPNIGVKNDIVMRYRVAKEWGLKKCNPTEILSAKKRLGALINRLTVYRELYDVETQAYEECITTRHNGLMWTREIALEEYLEGVIKTVRFRSDFTRKRMSTTARGAQKPEHSRYLE